MAASASVKTGSEAWMVATPWERAATVDATMTVAIVECLHRLWVIWEVASLAITYQLRNAVT
jgi:hypothetical protein